MLYKITLDLIAWRRLAVYSRNVAIYITRDYIVRQTKNLAFIFIRNSLLLRRKADLINEWK